MIQRILQKYMIDPLQVKALFIASLKLDFRKSTLGRGLSSGRSSKKSTFLYTILSYFFISIMMAVGIFKVTDVASYSFLILTISMVMLAMAIIIEFHEIIINPLDADILGHRPITSRTFFVARLANLFFYITIMGASLTLLPAVLGVWVKGSHWTFAPLFLAVSWMANLSTAAYMILFYTLLVKWVNYDRLKDILAYVQMALTFILVIGYQFIPRMSEHIQPGHIAFQFKNIWNFLVPPAWFAGLTAGFYSGFDSHMVFLSLLAIGSTAILLTLAFRNISLEYASYLQKISSQTERFEKEHPRRKLAGRSQWRRWFRWVRSGEEEFGFELTATYLKRDRTLRTRLFPSFGIPLAMLAFFLFEGSLSDPFKGVNGFETIFPLIFLVYVVFFFYEIISTSENWQGAWIFWVAPIEKPSALFWGGAKLFLIRYIIPFFTFVFLILMTQIPPWHAFLVTLLNGIIALVYFMFLALFNTKYPLSQPFERGQSNMRFLMTVLFIPVFVVGGGVEYLAFRFSQYFLPLLLVLLVILVILWKWADYLMDQRLRKLEFSG
ncbi:MAG: hypothetical protein GXO76_15405 [Calditrichaeota bacterium]|nr:hypothetical protein [Calditrichota bacterium]